MTRLRGRRLVAGGVAAIALAGCGSGAVSVPSGGSALPSLASPAGPAPADFTTVAALEARLHGVALCTAQGPRSAVCSLLTTSTNPSEVAAIRPFLVTVFRTTALTRQYVSLLEETNSTRASTGTAARAALVGPHWVVTPQTTTADLLPQLRAYLGGTLLG